MGPAYRLAEAILAQLNGATQVLCPLFLKARFVALIELSEDGIGKGSVAIDLPVQGTSAYPDIKGELIGRSVSEIFSRYALRPRVMGSSFRLAAARFAHSKQSLDTNRKFLQIYIW